jgi:hypothetical protein
VHDGSGDERARALLADHQLFAGERIDRLPRPATPRCGESWRR